MNRATGFSCPDCGRIEANVLWLELSRAGVPMSIRLHCNSCEAVFIHTLHTEEADRAYLSPARTGQRRRPT
jgi:hypothetical protein